MASKFAEFGDRFEECYSAEKLRHRLGKAETEPLVLIAPESKRVEVQNLAQGRSYSVVTYLENIHSDANADTKAKQILEAVKAASVAIHQSKTALKNRPSLLLIGSSTGGFPVVQELLSQFRLERIAVVICQHINAEMSENLRTSLVGKVLAPCRVVYDQTELLPGSVYLLSGGKDFGLKKKYGKIYLVPQTDSESVYHPSFNKLTESLLALDDLTSACVILSGLGADGSKYLTELKKKNVEILVQDPETAIAPGMPRSAIQTGAVNRVLGVSELRSYIGRWAA
jgi:chemotaxis response regulator CheB